MSPTTLKKALLIFMMMAFVVIGIFMFTTTKKFGSSGPTKFSELGGDFTVETVNGLVSLSDFRDKIVVLYFGFLNCPDVCPTSMMTIKSALKKLPQNIQEKTQVILISVDPDRDDTSALAKFAGHYNPAFVGATAESTVLDQITQQYAAYYSVNSSEDEDDYEVRHSSRYYLIDTNGQLVDAMRHSTTINELAARIELLYQQNYQG